MAYQLSWIKNFQFAGEYVADYRKYYQKFGLQQVDLFSGGPNIIVDAIVASGKALVGQSTPDYMTNAIRHGAELKCIGACYQRNNAGIVSMSKNPILTPQDVIGKKIGVPIINIVKWHAFLKLNKIDPSLTSSVPVQFEFGPLISGEVAGFFGALNDDAVELQTAGYDVHSMLLSDFGYKMFGTIYSVLAESLEDKAKRAQLVAFMKAESLGWQDVVNDPAMAADLTVNVYGKGNGLNLAEQKACCIATNDDIVSADTQKHGLFWMTPESVEETIASLALGGAKATSDMYTNEILEEAYQR